MKPLKLLKDRKNLSRPPYTGFADCYDEIMNHVDYQAWHRFLKFTLLGYQNGIFSKLGGKKENTWIQNYNSGENYENKYPEQCDILEIGCGTGNLAIPFFNDGFAVTGLDGSIKMLQILKKKNRKIPTICSEMKNFALNKKFDYIFSVHDTVNYLTEPDDLAVFFENIGYHLKNQGVFLFDLTTEYNILRNFHKKKDEYQTENAHIKWTNLYDKKSKIISSKLKFSSKERHNNNKSCFVEEHKQRIYQIEEIREIVKEKGFRILRIFSDQSFQYPRATSLMINYLICKE